MPKLPTSVLEKYPDLKAWEESLDEWFAALRETIEANQEVLLAKIQKLDS